MDRRRFMRSISIGPILGIAGCMSNNTNESSSPKNTETAPTVLSQTEERETRSPVVSDASLVTEMTEFEDIETKRISAAAAGSVIELCFTYKSTVHDGEHHVTYQVRIFDEDRKRIIQTSSEDRQFVEGSGWSSWSNSAQFNTETWSKGKYKAEIIVRDEIAGLSSAARTATFKLTEPLHASEVDLVEIDSQLRFQTGEDFQFSFKIRNTSDRDGTFRTRYSIYYDQYHVFTSDDYIDVPVAAGSIGEWTSGKAPLNEAGEYEFRLDVIDETWSVIVENR